MTTLLVSSGRPAAVRTDAVAMFVPDEPGALSRARRDVRALAGTPVPPLEDGVFGGKAGQTLVVHPAKAHARYLILVGLGSPEKVHLERLRRAAGVAARTAVAHKAATLAIVEPEASALRAGPLKGPDVWDDIAAAVGEGALLAGYKFDRYITKKENERRPLKSVTLLTRSRLRTKEYEKALARARILSEATFLARDLANAPGNEVYPETLAARARTMARKAGLRCRVLDQRAIRRLGMGGLLGVSAGSARPPRFIILEWPGTRTAGTIALVGKGVTFDSGGISIKPSAGMAEMKMDMSGAAAVIGAMQAVGRLRLPVRVVALIPATENLPSGTALKPGDILTHVNGMTSEVDNTDAEGRLILADALAYASRYSPDLVIDLATLTGACVVALGHVAAGMFGNDEGQMAKMRAAGDHTSELVWPLPLFDDYERLIKSDVADVKNVGGRWAGAITAAMFLKKFIGPYRWIHLDIAGTAMQEEAGEYTPRGGSGYGVRLLVEFLRRWRKP